MTPNTRTRDKKKPSSYHCAPGPPLFSSFSCASASITTRTDATWEVNTVKPCQLLLRERRAGRTIATRVEMISQDGLNKVKWIVWTKRNKTSKFPFQVLKYHLWSTSYLVICTPLVNVLCWSHALMLVAKGEGRDSCSHPTLQSAGEVSHIMLIFPVLLPKNVSVGICILMWLSSRARSVSHLQDGRWRAEVSRELSPV